MMDDETYESYRFILACDAAWCLAYENDACFMHDPWIEYAKQRSEPTLARNVLPRTHREKEVVELARQYGFQSAVIVPVQSPRGLSRLACAVPGVGQCGATSRASGFRK